MNTAFAFRFGQVCLWGTGLVLVSLPLANSRHEAKAPPPQKPPAHGGTIARFSFSDAKSWPGKKVLSPSPKGAVVTTGPVGTVDTPGGITPSGGIRFTASASPGSKSVANAAFGSGLLPMTVKETNLDKLTLSFNLSASSSRDITVRVESFDKGKKRIGGLETEIHPAAPDFYQRYALDLSEMRQAGAGRFSPNAPYVQFTFAIKPEASQSVLPEGAKYELHLDNMNYATPAFYVSPKGSDAADGRSEKTAFATPQKAIDVAGPGDIIVLMNGTYNAGLASVASFVRPGVPDAWIVLKNYPKHHPTLTSNGWNIVSVAQGSKEKPSDGPALAYLEIRGLHVRGEGDVAKQKYPDAVGKSDSRTNSNGIAVDGRYMKNSPHHIRMADNLVEYCPGQGLGALETDWVAIENNISRFNCWTTIFATSGISFLGASNFDASDNIYRMLIRNNVCYRNETFEDWAAVKRPSDGNGIIIDVNQKTEDRPNSSFSGRTLVQSNLSFDNGGSGIHTVTANRVDIINNTAYLNSASKKLEYSQIYSYGSEDVRITNNILVAPVADVAAGEKPEPVNKISGPNKNIVFSHNVYYGGNIAPAMGEGDVIAEPGFVAPSRDAKVANFHLQPGSPALSKGVWLPYGPRLDLDGKVRPRNSAPTIGAYVK